MREAEKACLSLEMREAESKEKELKKQRNGKTKNFKDLSCFICFDL